VQRLERFFPPEEAMKRVVFAVIVGVVMGVAWVGFNRLVRVRADTATVSEQPPSPARPPVPESTAAAGAPAPDARDTPPVPGAHLLSLGSRATSDDHDAPLGPETGRRDELEQILAEGDVDEVWTSTIKVGLETVVEEEPALRPEAVRCAAGFCGLKLTKPNASSLSWADIDRRLSEFAQGEKIFVAGSDGEQSTAYVYFSGRDGRLPLDPNQHGREE
jgi:hypothetical protein